jgi:hypothetical protein
LAAVNQGTAIALSGSGPTQAVSGGTASYSITVTDSGPLAATNAEYDKWTAIPVARTAVDCQTRDEMAFRFQVTVNKSTYEMQLPSRISGGIAGGPPVPHR